MRRIILFLLILAIPLGLLGWTHGGMTQVEDDVPLEPILTVGDWSALDGHTVRAETWCGDHMLWQTDFLPGGEPETDFAFIQDPEQDTGEEQSTFEMYVSGGVGMSTSGGFELMDTPMADLIRAVADQTAPGQEKTMTLNMGDYMEYYELSYEARIIRDQVYLWHMMNYVFTKDSHSDVDRAAYEAWAERFRFPVLPDSRIEVGIAKDEAGNINSIHYNFVGDAPMIGFTHYAGAEGMYFSPSFSDGDGNPLATGEFPEGCGIYYIPYLLTEQSVMEDGVRRYHSGFDFDGLRLVYPLEYDDQIITMEADEEAGMLHMLINEDGRFIYTRMDIATGEFVARLDIGTDYSYRYQLFPEEGLYLLNGEDRITLVNIQGEPKVEFSVLLPQGAEPHIYSDLIYEDGRLYLAGKDWYEGGNMLVLTVCDPEGVRFYGQYLWDQWASYEYVYGMSPKLATVAFLD